MLRPLQALMGFSLPKRFLSFNVSTNYFRRDQRGRCVESEARATKPRPDASRFSVDGTGISLSLRSFLRPLSLPRV